MKAIALLVLLSVAFCSEIQMPDYSNNRNIMQIMMQVEAKIKAGSPAESVNRLLQQFVQSVNNEQVNHDQSFARQNAECKSEFSFRQKEVSDSQSVLNVAGAQLASCQLQHARAVADLKTTKEQIIQNKAHLELINRNRKLEAKIYAKRVADWKDAQQAIQICLTTLDEVFSGRKSFAELAKHTNLMLIQAVKLQTTQFYAPVISALAQLASSSAEADSGLIDKVRNLIKNLAKRLAQTFAKQTQEEQTAIKVYNSTKARILLNLKNLAAQQKSLERQIEQLEHCISVQDAIVQAATNKKNRNVALWEDAKNLCGSITKEYQTCSQARRQELQLLDDIKTVVRIKLGKVQSSGLIASHTRKKFKGKRL